MTDIGTLGGLNSDAKGINNSGDVVGDSDDRAFLYSAGHMTDIGSLGGLGGSYAIGINSSGQVVGQASSVNGGYSAFLYFAGVMTDLNSLLPAGSNFHLDGAVAINDHGQIVGSGYYTGINGSDTASFLLDINSASAPEPASMVLLAVGVLPLILAARRRRELK